MPNPFDLDNDPAAAQKQTQARAAEAKVQDPAFMERIYNEALIYQLAQDERHSEIPQVLRKVQAAPPSTARSVRKGRRVRLADMMTNLFVKQQGAGQQASPDWDEVASGGQVPFAWIREDVRKDLPGEFSGGIWNVADLNVEEAAMLRHLIPDLDQRQAQMRKEKGL